MHFLFACLALLAQSNPNAATVSIVAVDGSSHVFPALDPNADALPTLRTAIDWCEAHEGRETIRIPAGTWKLSAPLELVVGVTYEADNVELRPLDAQTFQKSVVVAGASDWGGGAGTRTRADDVTIVGLTLPTRTPNVKTLFCRAFKADGVERHFRQHREAAE